MLIAEFFVVLALVLVNGIFSGAEIAVVALRKTRIQELAEEGRASARAVLSLRNNPERFLATVQVGITVVGAAAAAIGGASMAQKIQPYLTGFAWLERHAEGVALGLVIAGVSYLSIVIGELVPKSLALRAAERYALLIGRPLVAVAWFARPIVWMLSKSANLLLRPFGDKTTFTETRHSAEELRELVAEASEAGTIPPEAGEMASRALDLPDLIAADVMIPRQDVVMIPKSISREELRSVLLEHRFSRLPVYDGGVDNVVGYVTVKDVLALAWERNLVVLTDIVRPPYFVPDSKPVVALMTEMREQHLPFAIIVDEHGGMSGIVTMEDLVEEVVGEIFSEHRRSARDSIQRFADGSALVDGITPIREINRALDIELPEDGGWNTIAGLSLALAAGVPKPGEAFTTPNGIRLEIVDASARRVRAVRIRPPIEDAEPTPTDT
ncbi:MAG TPA: hemolysin family protein [Polyangiaceae bacterium]